MKGENADGVFKIAVVYVSDAGFHELTLYSLASIARSHRAPLAFFFMQSEYRRPAPSSFESMIEACGHKLAILEAPPFGLLGRWKTNKHITPTTFLRARAIDALTDRYDYILYVDGDALVFDDLHCERIVGFQEAAAACLDLSASTGFDDPSIFENCRRHGVSPDFFNAGVILVNARKWRDMRAAERFAEELVRHSECCPYFRVCVPNDQCALNMTLGSDLKRLPVTWNVQQSALHTHAWERATVRHYTGARKFLPVRGWRCDRRQYALLLEISRAAGLEAPRGFFDFGISYALNKLRRYKTVAQYEVAIARIESNSRAAQETGS